MMKAIFLFVLMGIALAAPVPNTYKECFLHQTTAHVGSEDVDVIPGLNVTALQLIGDGPQNDCRPPILPAGKTFVDSAHWWGGASDPSYAGKDIQIDLIFQCKTDITEKNVCEFCQLDVLRVASEDVGCSTFNKMAACSNQYDTFQLPYCPGQATTDTAVSLLIPQRCAVVKPADTPNIVPPPYQGQVSASLDNVITFYSQIASRFQGEVYTSIKAVERACNDVPGVLATATGLYTTVIRAGPTNPVLNAAGKCVGDAEARTVVLAFPVPASSNLRFEVRAKRTNSCPVDGTVWGGYTVSVDTCIRCQERLCGVATSGTTQISCPAVQAPRTAAAFNAVPFCYSEAAAAGDPVNSITSFGTHNFPSSAVGGKTVYVSFCYRPLSTISVEYNAVVIPDPTPTISPLISSLISPTPSVSASPPLPPIIVEHTCSSPAVAISFPAGQSPPNWGCPGGKNNQRNVLYKVNTGTNTKIDIQCFDVNARGNEVFPLQRLGFDVCLYPGRTENFVPSTARCVTAINANDNSQSIRASFEGLNGLQPIPIGWYSVYLRQNDVCSRLHVNDRPLNYQCYFDCSSNFVPKNQGPFGVVPGASIPKNDESDDDEDDNPFSTTGNFVPTPVPLQLDESAILDGRQGTFRLSSANSVAFSFVLLVVALLAAL